LEKDLKEFTPGEEHESVIDYYIKGLGVEYELLQDFSYVKDGIPNRTISIGPVSVSEEEAIMKSLLRGNFLTKDGELYHEALPDKSFDGTPLEVYFDRGSLVIDSGDSRTYIDFLYKEEGRSKETAVTYSALFFKLEDILQ